MADTSGILSESLVASMAAGLLDDYHVTSLDDDTALGRYMAREFGTVRNEILEACPWNIAKTRVVLSSLSTPPAFGWMYQYALPNDCLRAIPPGLCGTWNSPPIPFEVEANPVAGGQALLCNVGPTLKLIYIRKETNLSLWPALMGRAFAAKMAMYASQRVTGKERYFDKARTAFMDAMNEAKVIDGLARGTAENVYTTGYEGMDSVSSRNPNGYTQEPFGVAYIPLGSF